MSVFYKCCLFATVVAFGCGRGGAQRNVDAGRPSLEAPIAIGPPQPSVDEAILDRSADPCDDFYRYACGGWLDERVDVVDADGLHQYRGTPERRDRDYEIVRALLDEIAQSRSDGDKRLGDYYAACMDEQRIEKVGLAPLAPLFKLVATINDAASLTAALATLASKGFENVLRVSAIADHEDASKFVALIEPAILALPTSFDYMGDDVRSRTLRAAYEAHVRRMFVLLGDDDATAAANAMTVLKVERALVNAWPGFSRDPHANYHRIPRSDLAAIAPHIAWDTYLRALGQNDREVVVVSSLDYLRVLDGMVGVTIGSDDWKAFLRWRIAHQTAATLPRRSEDENWSMASFFGFHTRPPRWKHCVFATNEAFEDLTAPALFAATLRADDKERVTAMTWLIVSAMKDALNRAPFLDDRTRARAEEKLRKMTIHVAYPDRWQNAYEGFVVDRSSYASNFLREREWAMRRASASIGRPVDRADWRRSLLSEGAAYSPTLNEVVIPGRSLRPPHYRREATFATNFGGIGVDIGHELTHGFDDSGRQFDGDGNLTDWWSVGADVEFRKRAQCVALQFWEYVFFDNKHVDGHRTLGENIADLGGLRLAYDAMKRRTLDEMSFGRTSADQQFFLAYAQSRCERLSDDDLRDALRTDVHAPTSTRVNGPLSNMPEFAVAFHCRPGAKMIRVNRCEVW